MKAFNLILAGGILLVVACKEKSAPESKPANPDVKQEPVQPTGAQPAFAVPDSFQAALGQVYEGYTQIQTALAQDDFTRAKEAFSAMHATLHMMPKEGLDIPAKSYWDSTDTRIMAALHPMAAAETIDSVRIHFMEFSTIMLDAIEKFGMDGDFPVYQFHCPMANNNQGANWLQKDKELQNPYFGKSMPTCGSLVKTKGG